ncbi:hypothetical protein C8F01DRAFT_1122977 [Mycena amicta]|nr:hypothetical protein C8F01DRAFT_1122977 [Mycena amicta]
MTIPRLSAPGHPIPGPVRTPKITNSSLPNIQRGGACSNCRRRKLRCDGARPSCAPCLNRPPRSGEPCQFEQEAPPGHQTPRQMQGTIQSLTTRIEDLEHKASPALEDVLRSPSFEEPPREILSKLLETFIERFAHSGYFFLDLQRFPQAVLLPLPFGHPSRPSPALLSIVYLWGSLHSSSIPRSLREDTLLLAALQHLPADIRGFAIHPKLVVETIQAELLLSVYYLHAALPIQGRYHAAAAASLALSAGLHVLHTLEHHNPPAYPLAEMLLPPANDPIETMERVKAFWSVVFVNNCWVAVQGCPSAIPRGTTVDTPWPGGTAVGSTICRFLDGQETDGYDSFTLLAKASTLVERSCFYAMRNPGDPPIDATAFAALEHRLHTFQLSLPPSTATDRALILAHAFADLAILRLHAPLSRTSEHSRYQTLASAGRIAAVVSSATDNDPLYAPVFSAVCSVYAEELSHIRSGVPTPQARAQYHDIEERLNLVVGAMNKLALSSPIMQRCVELISGAPCAVVMQT